MVDESRAFSRISIPVGWNNELRNLTPMTALLNTGSLSDKDSANQTAMLFYENLTLRIGLMLIRMIEIWIIKM